MSEKLFEMRLTRDTAQRTKLRALDYIAARLREAHTDWSIEIEKARNPQSDTFSTIFVSCNRCRININLHYKNDKFSVSVDCFSRRKVILRAVAGVLSLGTFVVSIIYIPYEDRILMWIYLFSVVLSCEGMLWIFQIPDDKSVREIKAILLKFQVGLAEVLVTP